MCLTVDKEAIAQYDAKLKEERKRAEDQVRLVKLVKPFQRSGQTCKTCKAVSKIRSDL
jgi:hypothetical protein